MDTLRKRTPFKSNDDNAEQDDVRILDEQEQEEVIQNLRKESEASNNQFLIALRIIIGISACFHLVFLINPQAILSLLLTIRTHDSPIILSRLFSFLHIGVQLNVLLLSLTTDLPGTSAASTQSPVHKLPSWIADVHFLPAPSKWSIILSLVAPLLSVVSAKAWQQTAWWSMAFCLTLASNRIHAWIVEGEENIRNLEGLQYTAKGA